MRAQLRKGVRGLWPCKAYIGRTWGLLCKTVLWLYKRVIITKITYAAAVLWDGKDIALARSKVEPLHRVSCIMITGQFKVLQQKY